MKAGYQRSTAAYKTSFVLGFRLTAPFPITPQAAAYGKKIIELPVVQSFFLLAQKKNIFSKTISNKNSSQPTVVCL